MKHAWREMTIDIYNVYYYTFFKKDPCKSCLVQACCTAICLDKEKWNWCTQHGENKKVWELFLLISILLSVSMFFFGITRLIIDKFN